MKEWEDRAVYITELRSIYWKDTIYIEQLEIKWSGWLLLVFLQKLRYEVWLVRIKEKVGTYRNADWLLKTRPPNLTNKLSIKHYSITFISLFGRITINKKKCLQNKVYPFLRKDICIYGVHSFLGNTVGQISFNMSFSRVQKSND